MIRRRIVRVIVLTLVVFAFALSSVVSFQRHSETSRYLAVTVKTGAWAASELEADMRRFMHALELFGLGGRDRDQLILSFDLLWARVDVLRVGEETREVREEPGATELLEVLARELRRSEADILNIRDAESPAVAKLQQRFSPLVPVIRELNVNSFSGPARLKLLQEVQEMQREFGIYLVGLLLSGMMLVLLLLRESARNRTQALHDPLTGLPNRKYFNEHLSVAKARCDRDGRQMAIHVIDLNDFKGINDTLGHRAGDQLLIAVAERLKSCVRQQDTVARQGGDEFAVIQESIDNAEVSARLARRICESIATELEIDNTRIFPSASIGVSLYPEDADEADQVLVNADLAMYRAKRDSGVSYRFFEPEMNAAVIRRKRLSDDLRIAIARDQLALFYQPIIDLNSGRVEGTEALLRWHHDNYGYVPPPEIVSIAEQFGLARPLNEWVLKQACWQNQQWLGKGLAPGPVNVNISPAMYAQYDLASSVETVLSITGLEPTLLTLEVTEDTTMRDIDSSPDIMNSLRRLGVGLALDDFGTGYSSLSHLKRLPVQRLKIDRSFIQDLNNVPRDLRFVRTIIGLALSLELDVVAEGIEVEANVRDLRAEGCRYGQGYLFSRPLPAEQMELLLRKQLRGEYLYSCASLKAVPAKKSL